MGQWKREFVSRLHAGFFQELIDIDHSVEEYKRRYLANIRNAQDSGEVRSDIDPEFFWLVLEKTGELFKDGSWQRVSPDLGEAQRQLRTIFWQGLLVRE